MRQSCSRVSSRGSVSSCLFLLWVLRPRFYVWMRCGCSRHGCAKAAPVCYYMGLYISAYSCQRLCDHVCMLGRAAAAPIRDALKLLQGFLTWVCVILFGLVIGRVSTSVCLDALRLLPSGMRRSCSSFWFTWVCMFLCSRVIGRISTSVCLDALRLLPPGMRQSCSRFFSRGSVSLCLFVFLSVLPCLYVWMRCGCSQQGCAKAAPWFYHLGLCHPVWSCHWSCVRICTSTRAGHVSPPST